MVEANTAFHTQCRTQTSFSLLAAPSAANTPSQFCFSVLSFLRRKPRNNCPQNIVMHVLFSAYLYEVLGYCQVFYLNFVTCEKIHYKYLFLTGIFIILDFCNSPAINNETIAFKSFKSSYSCSKPAENPPAIPYCVVCTEACTQTEQNNLLFPRTVWSPKQPVWIRGC